MAVMAGTVAREAPDTSLDFDLWMASEQKRVYLLCLRLLQDSEEADIAAQDTFLKAFRSLGGEPPVDPARWLTRIAVNTCLDRLRSRRIQFWRRRPAKEDEQAILALAPASGPSPEQALHARQIGERLRCALSRLSDRQRSVFVLRHYDDRSLAEIARLLDLDLGTVKAHLSRALAKLRGELRDLYGRPSL